MKNNLIIKAIIYINEKNPSNHLPYHGIDHLYSVYEMCNKIVYSDKNYRNLDKKDELFIAALFHDFNHSGGKLTDAENISNAILGCNDFLDTIENTLDRDLIHEIIRATQFPSVIDKADLNEHQKIIQDADMCYLFTDLSIVKLYCGLRSEFNQDLKTFLDNQINFFNSLSFNTEYCNNLWNNIKNKRVEELELLKNNI